MDRRQLLKNACGAGACGCLCAGLLTPTEANAEEEKKKANIPPSWHAPFVKARYTALMKILHEQLGPKEFSHIIQKLGRDCSRSIKWISDLKGKPEEYFKTMKEKWHEDISYDKEKGIITISSSERTECTCPLIDSKKTPGYVCDCSLGWQKQTFETILGKKVDCTLEESLLRGGKRCKMKVIIHG